MEADELKRELHILKDAGIGGVEINPVKFPGNDTDDLGKRSLSSFFLPLFFTRNIFAIQRHAVHKRKPPRRAIRLQRVVHGGTSRRKAVSLSGCDGVAMTDCYFDMEAEPLQTDTFSHPTMQTSAGS